MSIKEHFNKNNPHHAYLMEGEKGEIMPEILAFLEDLEINILGNPDFFNISLDSFKIEDARNLKSLAMEKSFSVEGGSKNAKKVFIISVNSFLLEAQNTLLKIFEEPKEDILFFLIVPDASALLGTLVSRFYLIKNKTAQNETKETERFIAMSARDRIEYLKELLIMPEDEEDTVALDSARSKAIRFLNTLERSLHQRIFENELDFQVKVNFFEQIFKTREFLRQPGSSTKSLLEAVALFVPNF